MERNGMLLGVIPYDLRPPTLARVRERMWNPVEERIIVPRVFGIGWTLNFYRLREKYPPVFYAMVGLAVLKVVLKIRRALKKL